MERGEGGNDHKKIHMVVTSRILKQIPQLTTTWVRTTDLWIITHTRHPQRHDLPVTELLGF